jgi:AhpD family alkylhydroperoxidase
MNNIKTPWYVLKSPELGGPFQEFCEACKEKGVLDRKTKALILTAVSSVARNFSCIEEHIKEALDAGASKEEITEALLIASVNNSGTESAWKNLYIKYLA